MSSMKRNKIRSTWGEGQNVIFAIYGKESPPDYDNKDMLRTNQSVRRQDTFKHALLYISKTFPSLKLLLKTDDSFICRPRKLFDSDEIQTTRNQYLYWGHLGDPRFGEGHCEDDFGDHVDNLFAGCALLNLISFRLKF